jgi:leader peptidase (prepilin peptidase)/N-methyltransferase
MDAFIHPFLFFVLGTIVGSFLNVCIYRLPRKRSIVSPRSACPHCGTPIPWRYNIPILSWLYLRGHAACCKKRIAFRYFFVELSTAVLFAACSIQFPLPKSLVAMIFCSILMCASIIDLERLMVPDCLTLGGALLGLTLSMFIPSLHHTTSPFLGFMYGLQGLLISSSLLLWIGLIAEWILNKEAIGFGDVKLLGCFGAFLGWEASLFAIFGGACLGSLFFIIYVIAQKIFTKMNPSRRIPKIHLQSRVPFAPFLSLSSLFYLLFFQDSFQAYLKDVWIVFTGM